MQGLFELRDHPMGQASTGGVMNRGAGIWWAQMLIRQSRAPENTHPDPCWSLVSLRCVPLKSVLYRPGVWMGLVGSAIGSF